MSSPTPRGLIAAYAFDANGDRTPLDALPHSPEQQGRALQWFSFDGNEPAALESLSQIDALSSLIRDALIGDDPRPRLVRSDGGILLVLNAAGTQGELEDLAPLRIWAEPGRVITVLHHDTAVLTGVESGGAITGAAALVSLFVARIVGAIEPVIDELNDRLDALEEQLIQQPGRTLAAELGGYRRQLVQLHRYLAPQREVLRRLMADLPSWVRDSEAHVLREAAGTAAHQVEELQAARDHAAVIQEELSARLTDWLNRRIFLFTVIASVFLPLTFFTGLLGSNVDGIPFAGEPWAFGAVAVLCLVIASIQFAILRLMRLL